MPAEAKGIWGTVSTTLEYAIADGAIARFARALGDVPTSEIFSAKAGSWRNLFDPSIGLLRAKDSNGAWVAGVTDTTTDGYVEGTAAQYLWSVPQQPAELIAALGGNAAAIKKLDRFFEKLNAGAESSHAYIGNEPGFWAPWMYLWAGAPWRTQDVVRRVVDECFRATPHGLPGNDDLGALSSWLVWASIGIFPAEPGVGRLAVASPAFKEIRVRDRFHITAPAAPARYVAKLTLDGKPVTQPWLAALSGELAFTLTDHPVTQTIP